MSNAIFRPFDRYNFSENVCYLTGKPANSMRTVFPQWILNQFKLEDKPFKMLDERIITYRDITVPASADVAATLEALDEEIQQAFTAGFSAVKEVNQVRLFQWIANQVYGIIHWEIRAGKIGRAHV